jgi:ABC-type bacteriocin/lantibiotic exporter with double-glycine peptidase domain
MLITFGVVILRLLPSVHRIYFSISAYKYNSASMWTLYGTMCYLQKNYLKIEVSHDEKKFNQSIKLENVSYTYPGSSKTSLKNISLELPAGKFIGVVGRSGSGKSTFLDIITGMLQAESGRFYLDEQQFDPFRTDTLRRMMGYVPQQVTLMDDTIGFNIALSADWQEHLEKIRQAADTSNIGKFVESLDKQYFTEAGERGVKMSGGQRQRIGIARALYQNPEILVFDEATSSLDALTEQEIMDSVNSIAGDKTIIFATHRMQTVKDCAVIILFDKGQVAATGTHQELLANNQLYRDITSRKDHASQ